MDTVLIPIENENKLNGFHLDTISHIATVNNFRIGLVHNYLPQSQCQFPKSRAYALKRMKAVYSNSLSEGFPHRLFVREGRFDKCIGKLEKQSNSKVIVLPIKDNVKTLMNIIHKTDSTVYALPEQSIDGKSVHVAVFLSQKGELGREDLKRILSLVNLLEQTWRIILVSPTSGKHIEEFTKMLLARYNVGIKHHQVDSLISENTLNFVLDLEPDCLVLKTDKTLFKHFRTPKSEFFKTVLKKNIPLISF